MAQNPCAAPANAVVAENCLAGAPWSEWGVTGAGDPNIQGFATDFSVNKGATVFFKVKTPSASYRIDIYRIGYYGGNGARKVATVLPSAPLPQSQPNCLTETSSGLIDCGNWAVSASWAVPAAAVSGLYVGRLVRQDSPAGASHILFVVRDDHGMSPLLYQTSDTTWQAYNDYGGNSLYVGAPAGRAYKVSYNRPFVTFGNQFGIHTWWLVNEYPMIRWLERNGYNVSYLSGIDTDRLGTELVKHKVFLAAGHDEYWSAGQRTAVENARDAGVHLAFFTGNGVFWKTRWESSIDSSSTPYRTLVCYKETHANARIDPSPYWTGTWRDPRFSPPADGGRPEHQLMGTIFKVNCCDAANHPIEVSAAQGKYRFWRNTSFATLGAGQTGSTTPGVLGFEWDEAPADAFSPPGLIRLSTTTRGVGSYLQNYGSTYAPGTATHHLTLHRRQNGALVFGAGTIRWSWGLDGGDHFDGSSVEDARVQQATVNLFADMGVQPGSLQSNLVPASASFDTAPPVTTITAPAGGSRVTGSVTVTGTASDIGGLVAAVEVSVDGGATWNLASGTANWTYTWYTSTSGAVTIKSRGVDDSGNVEVPAAGVTVTAAPPAQVTIWSAAATPAIASVSDTAAVELGVKFRSSVNGVITAIRFYKGNGNTGTHVGKLWSRTGTLLAAATFTNETATGWQQASLSSPVAVAANVTYIASYFAPAGRYAFNGNYFTAAVNTPPLRALADGEDGGNGVYLYAAGGGFPTKTYNRANYWVDVVFSPTSAEAAADSYTATQGQALTVAAPGVLSNDSSPGGFPLTAIKVADPANGSVTLNGNGSFTYTPNAGFFGTDSFRYKANNGWEDSSTVTVTILVNRPPSAAGDAYAITQGQTLTVAAPGVLGNDSDPEGSPLTAIKVTDPANGTLTLSANGGFTYIPAAGFSGIDSFAYKANDGAADSATATVTITVSTSCPCTIWGAGAVPALPAANDTAAVELGVKFRPAQNGVITGIRFYKGEGNSGTHIGKLWTRAGTLLASATFTNETASGWQQVNFSSPVAVTANVTYIASYFAPVGRYSFNGNYFTSAIDTPPLRALADGEDGGNGVFLYAASGGFPANTFNRANYWVDVVFSTSSVVAVPDSYATSQGQALTVATPGVLANDINPGGFAMTAIKVTDAANGALALNANGSFTYTPNAGFAGTDSFSYRANNGWAGSNTATVTITVSGAPTAAPDSYAAASGQPLTVGAPGVLGNDSDPGGRPLTAIKLSNPSNGTVTLNGNGSFTYTPNAGFAGTDSFAYKANNGIADSNAATVTITAGSPCPCTIWSAGAIPAVPAANDTAAVEVGVKFRPLQDGVISGIRFYKGTGNGGTHVGKLWSRTGTLLASATFTNETATGWQQVDFATPVAVTANVTYVASYFAPAGRYAFSGNHFTAAVSTPMLRALADGEDGGNGVFLYAANGGFPVTSFNRANYWVDVVFNTRAPRASLTFPAQGQQVSGTSFTARYVTMGDLASAGVHHAHLSLDNNPHVMDIPMDGAYDFSNVPLGTHTLRVYLVRADHSYIPGTDSPTVTFQTTNQEVVPPTVSVTSPPENAVLTGMAQATANAEDNVGVAGVQFFLDGNLLGSEVTAPPYAISFNAGLYSAGAHVLTARARDAAGNTTVSAPRNFTISTAPELAQAGHWSAPVNWPVMGIHTVLLQTGKVLAFEGRGSDGVGFDGGVWDPVSGAFRQVADPASDLFCAGHAVMPDGRVLVVGGHGGGSHVGIADLNIFHPVTETWSAGPPMNFRRWYPTATALPSGKMLVTSGADVHDRDYVPIPEVYDPASNTWSSLTGANLRIPSYPHMFVLPDGKVAYTGSDEAKTPALKLDTAAQQWTTVTATEADGGSSVMYDYGKFMKSGTAADDPNAAPDAAATTFVIDFNAAQPEWESTAPMAFPRAFNNLTLLPDGTVLNTSGSRKSNTTQPVLEAELWSPATRTWTTLARATVPRTYHSSALLLPDGRVLVSGSGGNAGMPDERNYELFSPPYLFKGARPVIGAAPGQVNYGTSFFVGTADGASVTSAVLMRPGSFTHQFNQDQRRVPLTVSQAPGGLTIQAPANANLAPPGYYMLFLLNGNGAPSVARMVRVMAP